MNEDEFQQRSLKWMKRSYWVAVLSLVVAVLAFLWPLVQDREGHDPASDQATGTAASDDGDASATGEPSNSSQASDADERPDANETALAGGVDEDAYSPVCCGWFSLGSHGSRTDIFERTLIKVLIMAVITGVAIGLVERWSTNDRSRFSTASRIMVLTAASIQIAVGIIGLAVSQVTESAPDLNWMQMAVMAVASLAAPAFCWAVSEATAGTMTNGR